jgi:hypothetical protein
VDDEVLLVLVMLPELVEVELEVETLPELVETLPELVETLPELVETLPELVEVEVEMFPELVEVDPPEELVEPPDELVEPPEVLVEPVLVEVITMFPPDELPPPKNPPKNPPPKPPPQPPPITTGPPPPPAVWGGSGGSIGSAAIAICGAGSQLIVRVITRRMRLTWRGATVREARWIGTRLALTGAATLACFTYCGFVVFGLSATRAVRTDINLSLVCTGAARSGGNDPSTAGLACPCHGEAQRGAATTIGLTESGAGILQIRAPLRDSGPNLSRHGTEIRETIARRR